MNLRNRTSRYGFGVQFAAAAAGVTFIASSISQGAPAYSEIALVSALVAVLIMHARLGFALSKTQIELQMLQHLVKRVSDTPAQAAQKLAPSLRTGLDPDLSEQDRRALNMVREAVEAERVDLYLQPIVSLPQRRPRFYEAFSRLRLADGSVIRPASYLEAAERANRIGVIDNMILLRCIQSLRAYQKTTPRLMVFCNLSPATVYDTSFFNHLTDYLELNPDLATSLVFEFTYPATQMMHPRVEENLQAIAAKGFEFSIDHIHTLDVDWRALRARNFTYVKAPASLLLNANRIDEASALRVAAFRKRLRDEGIDLIAEKVEFESHMPEILSLGIDFGQGNLFGAARPAQFYLGDGEVAAPADSLQRPRLAIAS